MLWCNNDLQIYHDGSNSYLDNITGHIKIRNFADDSDIIFVGDDQSGGTTTYFSLDGSTGYVKFEDNRRTWNAFLFPTDWQKI